MTYRLFHLDAGRCRAHKPERERFQSFVSAQRFLGDENMSWHTHTQCCYHLLPLIVLLILPVNFPRITCTFFIQLDIGGI